jgi:hypothetical protein
MLSQGRCAESVKLRMLANRWVRKAQEKTYRAGLPNAYSLNGTVACRFPNGSVTQNYKYPETMPEKESAQ